MSICILVCLENVLLTMVDIGWSNGLSLTDTRNSWKAIHQLVNDLKIHFWKTALEGWRSSWAKTNSKQITSLQKCWTWTYSVKTQWWPKPSQNQTHTILKSRLSLDCFFFFFFLEKPPHLSCRQCLSSFHHLMYEIWPPIHLSNRWELSECVHIVGINKY